MEKSINAKKIALTVSVVTIIANFTLTVFKLLAGIFGNSSAMISDAIHSASDVASTVIVIIGISISSRPDDKDHQYGHERLECVSSIVLAVLLFITGIGVGYNGISTLIKNNYGAEKMPKLISLIASVISIAVKEGMFWYTYSYGKKINSLSLKADAWHHRSDAISSVGALLGIGGAIIFNTPVFDIIASLLICLLIIKVAFSIFKEACDKMVDKSCPKEKEEEIKNVILGVDGVITVDMLKTRMFGNKIYVDVEIGAYKNLTLSAAHKIAEEAHEKIERSDENIKHCMVHVNPVDLKILEQQTKVYTDKSHITE
ncbi:MAG: cation transporter [Clostridia bacterium]|nr:cation transporter [Clostridia bacterium]